MQKHLLHSTVYELSKVPRLLLSVVYILFHLYVLKDWATTYFTITFAENMVTAKKITRN